MSKSWKKPKREYEDENLFSNKQRKFSDIREKRNRKNTLKDEYTKEFIEKYEFRAR